MDSSVITWVVDSVLRPDDDQGMQFVLKMMPPQKDDVLTLLKHGIAMGAPRCIRTLTPHTGPKYANFDVDEWREVRSAILDVIPHCNISTDNAVMTVLNIAWLSWTKDMNGLLHEAIANGNWSLGHRMIQKGYMEGNEFGQVLCSLWDIIENTNTSKKNQQAASNLFDDMVKLLRDCKEESMQSNHDENEDTDDTLDEDTDDDEDDEEEDDNYDCDNDNVTVDNVEDKRTRDEEDDFSLTDEDASSNSNSHSDHMQTIARRVRRQTNTDSVVVNDNNGTSTDKMIQYVKGLFIGTA